MNSTTSFSSSLSLNPNNITSVNFWENSFINNARVLVIGERFSCGNITTSLEKAGHTVTQIESHVQALELVSEAHNYKLACVYSSGNPTILQFINKLNSLAGIPIIVIASGGAEAISKYLKSGACDCLNSPVCPELLKIRVSCILENIQLKEALRNFSKNAQNPVVAETVKVNNEKNDTPVEELKSAVAELQKRILWGDSEIEKKDTEIASLQHQLNGVSWRTSLLESERHKGETLTQQLSQKEREIDDMRKHMSRALETPIQVITRTLAQLSQGNLDQNQLRQAFSTLVQSVSSSSLLYQPAFTKSQFLESLNLDDMTRQWLLYEFTTGGLDLPSPQPNNNNNNNKITINPFSAPPFSPPMASSSILSFVTPSSPLARAPSPSLSLSPDVASSPLQLNPLPPLSLSSSKIEKIDKLEKIDMEMRPRSPQLLSEPKPRSPRHLPPVNPFPSSLSPLSSSPPASAASSLSSSSSPISSQAPQTTPGDAGRLLKSGRNVDDILKRASTTDVQSVNTYACNVWLFDHEELALLAWTMFDELGLVSQFKIPQVTFFQFMETLKICYNGNPYHNYQHAFDVAQTLYMFLRSCSLKQYITQMDIFAMMVAALCHDIDHPGLNNTFQINSKSPLAILYNDLSVLENHHCARAFYIMNDPKNNILSGLTPPECKEFRRTVVSAILATDMTTHFELLTRFTTHLDARPFSIENKDDRQLIVDILLHSADISNTCKPFLISKRWSDLLLEEFLNQGDLEKEYNMPISPFMNRQSTDHVKMTLNFMDYMVAPLCASLAKLFSGLKPLLENLQHNRAQWAEKTSEPIKMKLSDSEKMDSLGNAVKDKKSSRSFTGVRSGFELLQKGSPLSSRNQSSRPRSMSLSVPKGASMEAARKSALPSPPHFSKMVLPKLSATSISET